MLSSARLWYLQVDDFATVIAKLQQLLSNEELARAAGFKNASARSKFIISRSCLRYLLAAQENTSPQSLVIKHTTHGKPYLVSNSGLQFNVSHAQDYILIGLSYFPIGVDLEYTRRPLDYLKIASRFYQPKELALLRLYPNYSPAQRQCFFELWALKEAWAKAEGRGLLYSYRSCVLSQQQQPHLSLQSIAILTDYSSAICVAKAAITVQAAALANWLE